jgi:DNA polymerase-3 subunit delta'
MSLAPLVGHADARHDALRAIALGSLPQVVLVTGAGGVGKQRFALWLAQRLMCSGPVGEPCGRCGGCLRVQGLAHPDVHWFVPVPRPKAGEAEKQIEETAELLATVITERRTQPLWTAPDGMASHGIASARLIQRRASLTAAEGGWRVFIIGRAERLVPQESSPEAANALLKLLEEPPARTLFVLTTAEPGLVLPTIRSRAVPLRLGRVTDSELRSFLQAQKPELANDAIVQAARGAIGVALQSGDETASKARKAAQEFLAAVGDGPLASTERALRQAPWQARGDFTAMLDALAEALAAQARGALTGTGRSYGNPAAKLAGVERVLQAREQAQGNVNPQLLLAVLADDLAMLEAA